MRALYSGFGRVCRKSKILRVSQGIGYGGGLPPIAAAWLANGIFGVVGLVLLSKAKT